MNMQSELLAYIEWKIILGPSAVVTFIHMCKFITREKHQEELKLFRHPSQLRWGTSNYLILCGED